MEWKVSQSACEGDAVLQLTLGAYSSLQLCWVDGYVWTFSLWETLYCVHHLHFSLLIPASPILMRQCGCDLTHLHSLCRWQVCLPVLFFSFSTNENLLLSLSHISLCVHSLCWRAWCLCFHSAGWLTLAPDPSWVTQLVIWRVSNCSHIQTPHIARKVWFCLFPWLDPSLEPPACTASLSLLLYSQS